MQKVTIDAVTRAKLTNPSELLDESGKLVGMYLPMADYASFRVAQANAESDAMTAAEARRDIETNGFLTTQDLLVTIENAKRDWESMKG